MEQNGKDDPIVVPAADAAHSVETEATVPASPSVPTVPAIVIPAKNPISGAQQTEKERVSLGQRTVNLIWENTQMKVALSVIWVSLSVSFGLALFGKWLGSADIQLAAIVFLFGVANLVTGFYFGRTNHQRTGGVGEVEGR